MSKLQVNTDNDRTYIRVLEDRGQLLNQVLEASEMAERFRVKADMSLAIALAAVALVAWEIILEDVESATRAICVFVVIAAAFMAVMRLISRRRYLILLKEWRAKVDSDPTWDKDVNR